MSAYSSLPNWGHPLCPTNLTSVDWEAMGQLHDVIRNLEGVPQDPIWHAEGDVYTHTRMVVEELIQLPEWQALAPVERAILWLGALLHDIGKASCTRSEAGKIIAPRHAPVGAKMARALLYREELGAIPFAVRESVILLIRYHGLPLWGARSDDGPLRWRSVSQQLPLHWLALIAEADVRGRYCDDQEELLFQVQYFRELTREDQCYEQPFPFATLLARFHYFSKPDTSPTYVPYEKEAFEVTLLVGLPGSGKNTWIEQHASQLPVVSLDAIRRQLKIRPGANQGKVLQAAKQEALQLLRQRQAFVWNATNLLRTRRQALIQLFTTYGARVRIVYLEVPYPELSRRNRERVHQVPIGVVERFIDRMEVPVIGEGVEVEYGVEK